MNYPTHWKRIYETPTENDGKRILIDRLWPRGIKKDAARLDLWAKEIAPSTALRQLYHHGEMDFDHFSLAYLDELKHNVAAQNFKQNLTQWLTVSPVTFLYASKTPQTSHVPTLRHWLEGF